MRSAAQDIAEYLATVGIGTLAGASNSGFGIYIGREPETPNDVITVFDTGGQEAFADIELYTPTILVRVRADDYEDAYEKHGEIRDALIIPTARYLGVNHETRYIGIWMASDIFTLGRDGNDRILMTANYRIQRQPAVVTI